MLLPECIYRPGSFSGLMLLYESNYLKLMLLTGPIGDCDNHWISRARADNDLHVHRTLAEPYTTTLNMTYWLRDGSGLELKDPDMTVRIYHDAAQAEVLNCRSRHHHRMLRELAESHAGELTRRWQINMMLNKWLDYLVDCGHQIR
jgi:uncharacterized protein YqiB (DUF1249 family)